jgi:hypothetical protein
MERTGWYVDLLGVVDPGVTELELSGYSGLPSAPVSWRQVEGYVEQVCSSWVAATDRLL